MVVYSGIDPEIKSVIIERNVGEKDIGWGFPTPRHKVVIEWEFSDPGQEDGHVPKDPALSVARASTPLEEKIHEAVKLAILKARKNNEKPIAEET